MNLTSETRARLESYTANSDGLVAIDPETHTIVFFDAKAEGVFGYEADDVIGRPVTDLMPERMRAAHPGHVNEFRKGLATARAMGSVGQQLLGVTQAGVEFPVAIHIVDDGDVLVGVLVGKDRTLSTAMRGILDVRSLHTRVRALEAKRQAFEIWPGAQTRELRSNDVDVLTFGYRGPVEFPAPYRANIRNTQFVLGAELTRGVVHLERSINDGPWERIATINDRRRVLSTPEQTPIAHQHLIKYRAEGVNWAPANKPVMVWTLVEPLFTEQSAG